MLPVVYVGHERAKFLIQENFELTHERYCYCEAEVRSSGVNVVCVVRLCIEFLKAANQKEDLPLDNIVPKISAQIARREMNNCNWVVIQTGFTLGHCSTANFNHNSTHSVH